MPSESRTYSVIYDIVLSIPPGRVATYGQIASIAGICTARQVGFAMASVPADVNIPWHRVINSRGEISIRKGGQPCVAQRDLLEAEGVIFNRHGRIDLSEFGWDASSTL
jgi:alkylated DNA nucleotide flippase Atl1